LLLVERWNGVRWSIQRTPSPAAGMLPDLSGVSCVSRNLCIAVGSFVTSTYTARALVERWNGVRWSMQGVTNPTGVVSTAFFGISCTSRTTCIAVGNLYTHIQPVRQLPLAERWNGVRWSRQKIPTPASQPSPSLSSVSCSSKDACTAVGTEGLLERWNLGHWSIERAPMPARGTGIDIDSVSCPSARTCIAVGSSGNGTGTNASLAERWNGAGWRILRAPHPAQSATTALSGVWCTSASVCTAVGRASFENDDHLTFAQRWNGHSWAVVRTPNPVFDTGSSTLNGVSCTSAKACIAVGSYDNTAGRRVPLAERWNGTVWEQQQAPMSVGASTGELNGVSCAGATDCIAVGSYTIGSGASAALVEDWNGNTWRLQSFPSSSAAALSDVSCPSKTACAAVGGWTAAFWNGTTWTISNPLPPKPARYEGLAGVSCTSATSCTAVGSNPPSTLAEAWDGTRWSVQDTPDMIVGLEGGSWLDGVSCGSSTACVAVGGWGEYHVAGLLAEVWDGAGWALQSSLPSQPFIVSAQLNRVSCPAATACVSVGQLAYQPVAAAWDGTTWTIQHPPAPSAASVTTLNAVSCTSTTACTAVGSSRRSPYTMMTTQLIEHDP
jgi:hypothetical protein